jgi:hypothetical protein
MVVKVLVLENRRGILSSKHKQERQIQQSTNSRPASTSILCLLVLSFIPSLRLFNRCLNLLDRDLSPLSSRWFRTPTSFRLQTLRIRVLKKLQPLRMQQRIKRTLLVSTVVTRVIMLIAASADVSHPPQLLERLHHHQTAMKALPQPKLSKTTLEEEWITWLWKKLRILQPWCLIHLSSNLFYLNHSLLSFIFCSWARFLLNR